MPATAPLASARGPPLLPGLTAASVWMRRSPLIMGAPLTMPRVSEKARSICAGAPTAKTSAPVVSASGRMAMQGRADWGSTVRRRATSSCGAMRATTAWRSFPSRRRRVTGAPCMPLTTCAAVMTRPSELTKNPLPKPLPGCRTTTTFERRSSTLIATGRPGAHLPSVASEDEGVSAPPVVAWDTSARRNAGRWRRESVARAARARAMSPWVVMSGSTTAARLRTV